MKYILIIFLTLNIWTDLYGNTYGVMTGNIENVYYTGVVAGETKYQNQAIAFLCNEFIKKNLCHRFTDSIY